MSQMKISEMQSSELDKERGGGFEMNEKAVDGEVGVAVEPLPYPKSVFFIIATELSERFSYYGMRAVLTIYMRNTLGFSEDSATTLYHTFLLLCYGLPIFWGIVADSFLGKFQTIWTVSVLFAVGNIVLTLSSLPMIPLPAVPLTMLGLFLMALGTGGMKPCVAPFGGEQFELPQQKKQLQQFFSVFFFAVTVGNMISTVITPVFRHDVQCFGMENCYPLAFGVPASIMIFAVVIFLAGKSLYKIYKPEGNMLVRVLRCMLNAAMNKKNCSNVEKSHWLHYADDKYDQKLIKDIQMLLRVLVYYIPIPMFFALYEQLGSRFTFQATRMSGVIGNFTIKPDQMQVTNAILMFIFIPVFQMVVYPLLKKCNLLVKPLQRMGVGGFLAASSFFVAGMVELKIEKTQFVDPTLEQAQLNIVNTLNCPLNVAGNFKNDSLVVVDNALLTFPAKQIFQLNFEQSENEAGNGHCAQLEPLWNQSVELNPAQLKSLVVYSKNSEILTFMSSKNDSYSKSKEGNAKVRFIIFTESSNNSLENEIVKDVKLASRQFRKEYVFPLEPISDEFSETATFEIVPGTYAINKNNGGNGSMTFEAFGGANYVFLLDKQTNRLHGSLLVPGNEVHMLWLLPQYILMAWAEILFIVSGMEFSFTQAPRSMKSVLQSLWHFMNAMGNVLVILSAQLFYEHSQATEFFGFSLAMFLDIIIFCCLAMGYTYVDISSQATLETRQNLNMQTMDKETE